LENSNNVLTFIYLSFPARLIPVMYHRPGAKPNPYKPMFGAKDTMLTGRIAKDIITRPEHDDPNPTHVKKLMIPKAPDQDKEKAVKEKK
jgi:hypothetical protein